MQCLKREGSDLPTFNIQPDLADRRRRPKRRQKQRREPARLIRLRAIRLAPVAQIHSALAVQIRSARDAGGAMDDPFGGRGDAGGDDMANPFGANPFGG